MKEKIKKITVADSMLALSMAGRIFRHSPWGGCNKDENFYDDINATLVPFEAGFRPLFGFFSILFKNSSDIEDFLKSSLGEEKWLEAVENELDAGIEDFTIEDLWNGSFQIPQGAEKLIEKLETFNTFYFGGTKYVLNDFFAAGNSGVKSDVAGNHSRSAKCKQVDGGFNSGRAFKEAHKYLVETGRLGTKGLTGIDYTITVLDLLEVSLKVAGKAQQSSAAAEINRLISGTQLYLDSKKREISKANSKENKTQKDTDPKDQPPPPEPVGQRPSLNTNVKIYLDLSNLNDCGSWASKSWIQKAVTSSMITLTTKQSAVASAKLIDTIQKGDSTIARIIKKMKLPKSISPKKIPWLLSVGGLAATGGGGYYLASQSGYQEGADYAVAGAAGAMGLMHPIGSLIVAFAATATGQTTAKCVLDDMIFGAILGSTPVLAGAATFKAGKTGKNAIADAYNFTLKKLSQRIEKLQKKIPPAQKTKEQLLELTDDDLLLLGIEDVEASLRVKDLVTTEINDIQRVINSQGPRTDIGGPGLSEKLITMTDDAFFDSGEAFRNLEIARNDVKAAEFELKRFQKLEKKKISTDPDTGEDVNLNLKRAELEDAKERLAAARLAADSGQSLRQPGLVGVLSDAIDRGIIIIKYDPEAAVGNSMSWAVVPSKIKKPRKPDVGTLVESDYDYLVAELNARTGKMLDARLQRKVKDIDGNVVSTERASDILEDAIDNSRQVMRKLAAVADDGKDVTVRNLRSLIKKLASDVAGSAKAKELIKDIDLLTEKLEKMRKVLKLEDSEQALKQWESITEQVLKRQMKTDFPDNPSPSDFKLPRGDGSFRDDFINGVMGTDADDPVRILNDLLQKTDITEAGNKSARAEFLNAWEEIMIQEWKIWQHVQELEAIYTSMYHPLKAHITVAASTKPGRVKGPIDTALSSEEFKTTFYKEFSVQLSKALGVSAKLKKGADGTSDAVTVVSNSDVLRRLAKAFNPETGGLGRFLAGSAGTVGYLLPSMGLYYAGDKAISNMEESSIFSSDFVQRYNQLSKNEKTMLIKVSWRGVVGQLLLALKSNVDNSSFDAGLKNLGDVIRDVERKKNIMPLLRALTERGDSTSNIQKNISPPKGYSLGGTVGWFFSDEGRKDNWSFRLSIFKMREIVESENFNSMLKIGEIDTANVGGVDTLNTENEELFFATASDKGNDSYFMRLYNTLESNKGSIINSAQADPNLKENKSTYRRPRLMTKDTLKTLIKEAFRENIYGKYPYSHRPGMEGEPLEDYEQDWNKLSLDILEDRSRNMAIQFAKILVKEFELLTFVLDAVGADQSLGTEILKRMEQLDPNDNLV